MKAGFQLSLMMRRVFVLILLVLTPPLMAEAQIVRPPDLRLQFHRAERAFRTGASSHEAKRRLDLVLEALPNDAEARMLRASVLLDLGKPEEALADAQQAVRLLPDDGEAHLLLSEAARAADQNALALRALDNAAARITDGANLHIRLSYGAEVLGDLDRAEAYARLARALDGTLPGAYRQLARVFLAKNRVEAATTLVATGLKGGILSPSDIRADDKLSALMVRPELAAWFE